VFAVPWLSPPATTRCNRLCPWSTAPRHPYVCPSFLPSRLRPLRLLSLHTSPPGPHLTCSLEPPGPGPRLVAQRLLAAPSLFVHPDLGLFGARLWRFAGPGPWRCLNVGRRFLELLHLFFFFFSRCRMFACSGSRVPVGSTPFVRRLLNRVARPGQYPRATYLFLVTFGRGLLPSWITGIRPWFVGALFARPWPGPSAASLSTFESQKAPNYRLYCFGTGVLPGSKFRWL